MPLIDSYRDLITSQHRGHPNYMATVTALLTHSEDIFSLGIYLDDLFDLDEATGKQEDVLGVIVGASRILPFQPDQGLSPVLDNAAYRNLLKAKIAKNMWKGGIEDLKVIWETLFGQGIIIQDNQDMTIDVVVIGIDDFITQEMIRHGMIVPKPQSVGINYYFSQGPVFGYDMENDWIRGYDHAYWMYENSLPAFSYDEDSGYDNSYWT